MAPVCQQVTEWYQEILCVNMGVCFQCGSAYRHNMHKQLVLGIVHNVSVSPFKNNMVVSP